MSDANPPVTLDDLLAHRRWVRGLARRLAADESAADDLEQETWLAALRTPPRRADSPRAWLGTVIRNLARTAHRRSERRERHEDAVAPPSPATSAADVVAEAELQTRLVRAVLELEEPYRSTVLFRFFHGLEATEIAARTGVPVETVRTRVKRAVERLRERMDADLGDDRDAWCLLAFGVKAPDAAPVGPGGAAALRGGAAMATGKKALVAAAVVIVAAAASWRWVAPHADRAVRSDAAIESAAADIDASNSPAGRRRSAGAVAGTQSPANPKSGEMEVVVTARGAPADGVVVDAYLDPPIGPSRRFARDDSLPTRAPTPTSSTRTDAAGVARLALGSKDAFVVVARKPGFAAEAAAVRPGDLDQGWSARLRLHAGFALSGRVVDGAGRGVAGATVLGETNSAAWRGRAIRAALGVRATADGAGRFSLADLPAGPVRLLAARPGGVGVCAVLVDVPNVTTVDLVLDVDAAIAGVVTDAATGAPVAEAIVDVFAPEQAVACAASTTTDASGAWRVEGIPSDVVIVKATKSGYLAATPPGDAGRVRLAGGRTAKCDLVLRRGASLAGRILGPDGPVAGATVTVARASDNSPERPQTTSAADGAYRFDALAPGEVFVVVSAQDLYQSGFGGMFGECVRKGEAPREAAVVVPDDGDARLDVRLTRGLSVSGRVIAPDGKPAAHAEVSLRYDVSCESDGTYTWQETKTGDDGGFRFTGVAPTESVTLFASYGTVGAAYDVKVPLDPARGADGVTLTLVAGGTLVVRVHAPEGVSVLDAVVQAIGADGSGEWNDGADPWRTIRGGAVDADGTRTIDVPPFRGTWVVRAVVPGRAWSSPKGVDVDPDRKAYEVELTLVAGGGIEGAVVNDVDAPVAGARISVRKRRDDDARRMIAISTSGERVTSREVADVFAVTDARGRFRLDPLQTGAYEMVVTAAGFVTTTENLDVPTSDAVRVELAPALVLRGRVHFADGRPLASVRVSMHSEDDGTPTDVRTDADGAFAFEGLRDCGYYVSVHPSPAGPSFKPRELPDVSPRSEPFDVVVEAASVLAGRIVDADGRPVPECSVQLYHVGDGPMIDRFAGNNASADTDDDGRFEMSGIDDGKYVLLAGPQRTGAGPFLAPMRIDGVAAGTTGLVVQLKPGLAIAGRVVDAAGNAVACARVGVEGPKRDGPDPDADRWWVGRISAPVDAAGAFRIDGLPAGRWRVVVLDDHWSPSTTQVDGDALVRAGDVDVRLVGSGATTIGGAVVDDHDAPTIANVTLAPVDGGPSQSFQTDDTGKFVFIGLQAGLRYRLVAAPREHELIAGAADVAAGTHDARVKCGAALRAAGRLLGVDGAPIFGVLVRARRDGVKERYGRTDSEGRFVVPGLSEGDYRVDYDAAPPAVRGTQRTHDWRECGTLRAGDASVELRASQ